MEDETWDDELDESEDADFWAEDGDDPALDLEDRLERALSPRQTRKRSMEDGGELDL
jgi:hypothetical protein